MLHAPSGASVTAGARSYLCDPDPGAFSRVAMHRIRLGALAEADSPGMTIEEYDWATWKRT